MLFFLSLTNTLCFCSRDYSLFYSPEQPAGSSHSPGRPLTHAGFSYGTIGLTMQDLWADFAGELRSEDEARRGLRQRRPGEQAVLAALRAWLLQDYMLPYGASLGATRIFKRCYWIDGLGNTSVPTPSALADAPEEGIRKRARRKAQESPLPPALQMADAVARHLAQLERPITLHAFALEERRGKQRGARAGQHGTGTQAALPKEGGTLPGSWQELAPSLMPALEGCAAVFLLNPLRSDLFRYADLAPLYTRAAPTELFLWLPHKRIEARLLPALRTGEGAAALTNLLRGDRWKTLLAKDEEFSEHVVAGLIELLAQSMRQHFLTVQLLAFPVRTGPALVESVPSTLLFATRRQDSLACMNDAVCLRARRLVAESHQGVLNEQWFAAQREEQNAERLAALAQEVLALGRAQRIRRWPDLRQQLLLRHFGQHTLQDYNGVIGKLLAQGEVRCEWRKRDQEPGPFPGNDDLLLWK